MRHHRGDLRHDSELTSVSGGGLRRGGCHIVRITAVSAGLTGLLICVAAGAVAAAGVVNGSPAGRRGGHARCVFLAHG